MLQKAVGSEHNMMEPYVKLCITHPILMLPYKLRIEILDERCYLPITSRRAPTHTCNTLVSPLRRTPFSSLLYTEVKEKM